MTFEEKYPKCWKDAKRFELTDARGKIIESWERNDDGIMVCVTARDHAREELVKAREEYEQLRMELGNEDKD